MEQIVLFLKSNRFANRVFKDVSALKEACRTALQWLTARRHHENDQAQLGHFAIVLTPMPHCIGSYDLRLVLEDQWNGLRPAASP